MSFSTGLRNLLPVAVLFFAACSPRPLHIAAHQEQQYPIKKENAADSFVTAMLRPYKRGVDTQMQIIIGHTDIPLTKAQPESTLGNFIADATLVAARKIDPNVLGAVGNYGGVRLPYIAPGPISRGKMYELMPFDNMLTILEIPGKDLLNLCDGIAMRKGWPVSGITFIIKDKKAIDVKMGGQVVNPSLIYKIAVSDYIARGGDNCDMLVPLKKRFTTVFLRDAMIDYVAELERAGKPLHPLLEQRIQYAE